MTQKFSLQRVLDFKEQVEDLLQIEVAAIEGRRIELQHAIETMQASWKTTSLQLARGEIDPPMIGTITDYLVAIQYRIEEGVRCLTEIEAELEGKRRELTAAYQEREMLQRLKERHATAARKAEQRRDNRTMEEVATQQYLRREDSGPTSTRGGSR
jgi:flagellar FliJ protein